MKYLFKIAVAGLTALAIAGFASAEEASPGQQNETTPLPIAGMVAAVKNGKLAFVSSNGRFVFQGTVYDNWNQTKITSIAEAKQANDYINIKKLDFKADELQPLVIGDGPKEVIVYFDPYCPSCHNLIEDARKVEGYSFKFLAVPGLGEDSMKAVRYAFCTDDKERAEKVLLGKVPAKDISVKGMEKCNTVDLAKRVISSQLFGIQGLPFMVRDDGLVRLGYVNGSLSNWLQAGN